MGLDDGDFVNKTVSGLVKHHETRNEADHAKDVYLLNVVERDMGRYMCKKHGHARQKTLDGAEARSQSAKHFQGLLSFELLAIII